MLSETSMSGPIIILIIVLLRKRLWVP